MKIGNYSSALATLAILFLLALPCASLGQEHDEPLASTPPTRAHPPAAGTMLFTFHGGPGVTYPTGEIAGSGDQRRLAEFGYSIGISISYLIFDWGGPFAGGEYMAQRYGIRRTYGYYRMTNRLDCSFFNVLLGYRFILFRYAYADLGLFYGANIASWKERTRFTDYHYTIVTTVPRGRRHDAVGLILGAGGMIPVTPYLQVDLGMRFLVGFVPAFTHMDRLIPNIWQCMAGVTFKADIGGRKQSQ